MDLSVVIVTYNSGDTVMRCLESLEVHPPTGVFETIVIDNASSDGTPERVRRRFPRVRLVADTVNRGYSKGVNRGMREASGRYILVLNPDIEVTDGSIDRLVSFMEDHPRTGLAGAKLVWPDGRVQPSCRSFYTLKALLLRRTFLGRFFPRARPLREHLMSDYDHETARRVDWVLGGCMIVRREALDAVGPMDERFFLYFEDTDWCYRMQQHGWEVWYVPDSVMIHRWERSSARSVLSRPFVNHLLSMLRYYEKWNALFRFMRRHRIVLKTSAFLLSDLVMINAAFFLSYWLRGATQRLFINELYPLDWYLIFIIFFNLVFVLTFTATGLYRLRRETGAAQELAAVVRATMIVFAVLLTATYLTRIRIFSRAVLTGQAVFTVVFVTAARRAIRAAHRRLVAASFDLKRVVLAGTTEEAAGFVDIVAADPGAGIDIVGRVGAGEGTLGPAGDLASIVERFHVQEVVLFPSMSSREHLLPLLTGPAARSVRIRIVSPLASLAGPALRSERIGPLDLLVVDRGASMLATRALQRAADLLAGLLLLPVTIAARLAAQATLGAAGRIRFFTEQRTGRIGPLAWPRAVLASGREASDLVKPRLAAHLVSGRLSLIGPPSLPPGPRGAAGHRPGISGRWRIEPLSNPARSVEDGILMLHNESITGRILISARSVIPCLTGRYPEWFHEKGEAR
jgi:N-acetylglucosaminyl-diphospho-decaprenol L-rhamnosyltransferase